MKSILILITLITVCTSAYATTTKPVTQKQAKTMKLTTTNKPVRKTVHKKGCVVMVDKKTRKAYTVCPN